jgi:hypothetical protein
MVRHLRLEYEGAFYHLTSRGKAQAANYLDDEERAGFLGILRSCFKISQLARYGVINRFKMLIYSRVNGAFSPIYLTTNFTGGVSTQSRLSA